MANPLCHFEVMTSDPERAKAFYGSVLAWRFDDQSMPGYTLVNTGAEPQKAGILPEAADGFIADCRAWDLPLAGVMCIPPDGEDPQPHFAALRQIGARNGLAGLSMGMSGDFETAIAEGATHIRVGSAIFGERAYG